MINVLGTIFYFLFLFVFLIVYFPIFALIWLVTLPFDPKKVVFTSGILFPVYDDYSDLSALEYSCKWKRVYR